MVILMTRLDPLCVSMTESILSVPVLFAFTEMETPVDVFETLHQLGAVYVYGVDSPFFVETT